MLTMNISDLRLKVYLGCNPGEHDKQQTVSVDIILCFPEKIRAVDTDNIEDAICYDGLCKVLKNKASGKKYNLVEHLTKELYDTVATYIKTCKIEKTSHTVKVKKMSIPIEGLHDGVSIFYSEINLNN